MSLHSLLGFLYLLWKSVYLGIFLMETVHLDMYKIVDLAKQCLTIYFWTSPSSPNQILLVMFVGKKKKSFIVWQNTAWKTFPMLVAKLIGMVMFTFSAYPEAWTDTINSRTLSIVHVHWHKSQAAAHTVPSAKPGLGDGSLAPTEEQLHLQMVSEKSEGGRRIRLCDCGHIFSDVLYINFFSWRSWQIWDTHRDIFQPV